MTGVIRSVLATIAVACTSTAAHSPPGDIVDRGDSTWRDGPVQFPLGCYRADRLLAAAARVERGLAGHGFSTFQLRPDGRVARPQLISAAERKLWAARSVWTRSADTLDVQLSTGFSGWALRLAVRVRGADTTLVGTARYFSDARIRDTTGFHDHPLRVPVLVVREACGEPGSP